MRLSLQAGVSPVEDAPPQTPQVSMPQSHGPGKGGSAIAFAVNPDDISTPHPEAREWLMRGLILAARNGECDAAIGCYDGALVIDPDFTEAWLAKGVALHNLGRNEEAIDCHDHALVADPENAGVFIPEGSCI